MDLQRENHSELNLPEDSRRQQRKGKGMKSSLLQTEQQISSVEVEFQNASEDLQGNDDKHHCKDSPSPPEKLVAGILGVICCVLLFTVVRMILWSQTAIAETQTTGKQKAYHCGRCPAEWIMYSNHCYYISTERKTWNESLTACASQNSSLLHVDDEEERKFLRPLSPASWIGVFRRIRGHPWTSINGSIPTLEIAEPSSGNGNCVTLHRYGLTSRSCESSKIYICKHRFHG